MRTLETNALPGVAMIENQMIESGRKALEKRERSESLYWKAFRLHVDEFLGALRHDPHTQISAGGEQVGLWEYVAELLADDTSILALLRTIRDGKSVPLLLAEMYAGTETDRLNEQGAFDV